MQESNFENDPRYFNKAENYPGAQGAGQHMSGQQYSASSVKYEIDQNDTQCITTLADMYKHSTEMHIEKYSSYTSGQPPTYTTPNAMDKERQDVHGINAQNCKQKYSVSLSKNMEYQKNNKCHTKQSDLNQYSRKTHIEKYSGYDSGQPPNHWTLKTIKRENHTQEVHGTEKQNYTQKYSVSSVKHEKDQNEIQCIATLADMHKNKTETCNEQYSGYNYGKPPIYRPLNTNHTQEVHSNGEQKYSEAIYARNQGNQENIIAPVRFDKNINIHKCVNNISVKKDFSINS